MLLPSNHLPLTAVGSNPNRNFGFFHVRKLSSTFQLAYGMFMVLLRYSFVPSIMHRRAPEVFLHQ
jgi:hypothetical protein